jgi:hypothetical protein
MKSYHQNRDKTPTLPENRAQDLQQLNSIIADPDVSVVFLVFKYPANSPNMFNRVQKSTYNGKPVLKLVLDAYMIHPLCGFERHAKC